MKFPKNPHTSGQTLAEYALLVAFVAVACIAALTVFGAQLQTTTEDMSTNGTAGYGGIMGEKGGGG